MKPRTIIHQVFAHHYPLCDTNNGIELEFLTSKFDQTTCKICLKIASKYFGEARERLEVMDGKYKVSHKS